MSVRASVAAVAVALALSGTVTARAADLYGENRYGQAYDDPRYSDMYGHPPPPPRQAAPYAPPYAAPPVAAYREPYPPYRDERGYLREMPPPPAFDPRAPGQWNGERYGGACVPPHIVRLELERQGWHDVQDFSRRGEVVRLRARQHNGRWFDLTVDRCNGAVLEARVVDRRAAGYDDWRYRGTPQGY